MTSLAVTIPSNMSAMVNTESLAKYCENNGKNLIVKPIADVREKGGAKSKAIDIVELRNDLEQFRMRESNLSRAMENQHEMKTKMFNLQHNGNNNSNSNSNGKNGGNSVRGNFDVKNVGDVVDSLHKTQDTHENSPTGCHLSREEKVSQESQQRNRSEKVQIFTNRKLLLKSKTDANDRHENSMDTGTHLVGGSVVGFQTEASGDANNCCDGLAEKCVGVTMNGSENPADDLDVTHQKNATTIAKTTGTGTVGAPVRPKTLVTAANSYPKGTQTSPLAKSTPRTPNLTPQHHKSTFHNCLQRKCKHIPSEVPRTTAALANTTNTKLTPKTPPVTPDSPATYLDDDVDSIYSFATSTSGLSMMSCEHAYVAHNGTTFSARKNKFVVHNSQYAGLVGSAYITPTQRARNQIQKLKGLLNAMQHEINQKNDEILRLTREVAELRLFKASLNSPEERSASSDAVTVREAELQTSQDVSPIVDMVDDATKSSPTHNADNSSGHYHQSYLQHQQNAMQRSSDMQSSFADSGHFEDMTSMSVHSKDSYAANSHDGGDNGAAAASDGNNVASAVAAAEREVEVQRQELIRLYEQRIEELIRNQDVATTEMKRNHNDKIESLLQKLSECNTRYADIVPDYEVAKERIRELESQLDDLQHKLFDHEEKQNKMYLHMYQKGQEAERIARADQALELAYRAPNNHVSINELLHQLQSTQEELENIRTIYRRLLEAQKSHTQVDPEVTLQFLKSAVYYFLTDKENSQGHLQAIESILEFTEAEKQNINRARAAK